MLDLILLFVMGLLLALAINGLADGWPRFLRPDQARPCPHCAQPVAAPPLAALHWLRQRGRCPTCAGRLALRPPLVELVMAIGLPLLWLAEGWTPRLGLDSLYLAVGSLIVAIDVEHLRIPNAIVYPMILVATAASALGLGPRGATGQVGGLPNALVGGGVALAAFAVFFIAGALFAALLKAGTGPGLGMGDVKLATLVGLVTGYPGVVQALFVTLIAGALAALMVIGWQIIQHRYKPGRALPYGPFLVLGALWALLLG